MSDQREEEFETEETPLKDEEGQDESAAEAA